jgi:MFS family permease
VAFGLAAVGYLSLGLISNPFGPWMIPVAILVGVGESSAIVASAVLIGQEAPAAIRGAALGASSLAAAAGYMILTYAGGQLFDALGRTTPFIMMALVNGVVFIAALAVRRLHLTDPGVSGA